jgi:hypothetical protein
VGCRSDPEAQTRDARRIQDLQTIVAALERYRAQHGQYPPIETPALLELGLADGCVSSALVVLAPQFLAQVPEDPRFTRGYWHPGPDRWCYYYRKGPGRDVFTLYARLEDPRHAAPSPCSRERLYRPEIAEFNFCLPYVPPHRERNAWLRLRLRLRDRASLPFFAGALGTALLALASGLAFRSWRDRRHSAPATAEAATVSPPDLERLDRRAAVFALFTTIAAFHFVTVILLRWYYRTYLPHYDSIGSYTVMARVLHVMRDKGLGPAWAIASSFYLGWLQPAFVIAFAPVLAPSPAGVQLLNSFCLAFFVLAAYVVARDLDMSRVNAYLMSLVILLPDALTNWDGGLQDMKRDGQFLPLLGATFLLTLAQLWRPTTLRGAALGVAAALTVWSRGEAPAYMGLILVPIVGVWMAARLARGEWRAVGRALAVPAIVFAAVAGPNLYATGLHTVARRLYHYHGSTQGVSRWLSLLDYGPAPIRLWGTRDERTWTTDSVFLLGLCHLALFVLAAAALWRFRLRSRPLAGRTRSLLIAGAWAAVATVLLICVGARLRPGFGWAGLPPFYPSLLAPLTLVMAAIGSFRSDPPSYRRALVRRWIAAVAIGTASVGAMGLRMFLKTPPEVHPVAVAGQLFERLYREKPEGLLAVLTHDVINFDTLVFLNAQRGGGVGFRKFAWKLPSGEYVDFATEVPRDIDVRLYQDSLLQQIQEQADFVIAESNLDSYRRPLDAWNWFIPHHGARVVRRLLADPKLEPMYEYAIGAGPERRNFVVLRNLRRFGPASTPPG